MKYPLIALFIVVLMFACSGQVFGYYLMDPDIDHSYIKADGTSGSLLSINFTVGMTGEPVAGVTAIFRESAAGSLSSYMRTSDSNGHVETTFTSSTTPEVASVSANCLKSYSAGDPPQTCLWRGSAYWDIYVVKAEITGPNSLVRGEDVTYTATVLPSGVESAFEWKFTGNGVTIEENTGSSNIWNGVIVVSGTISGIAVFGEEEFNDTLSVTVNPRDWMMANPPSAQEVTAPEWDGTLGSGTASYQYNDEIQGNPGYVSSGPNKGFYYILSENYWENWESFQWWITPGFRSSAASFWVKTKQEEDYDDQQVTSAIQGLIGHETDGTGANTLGHRKTIIANIQGNPSYDPKRSIESLVSYNNSQQLGQDYTQTVYVTIQSFEDYYKNGEGHPSWGNWSGYVWFTDSQNEWVRHLESW